MLTCSSCCVTVTFTRGSPTLVHLTNFCTNFTNFFSFGKFVKIREFFFCWGNEFSIYGLYEVGKLCPLTAGLALTRRTGVDGGRLVCIRIICIALYHDSSLTRDHTVLPATHTFIHKWNEPYLPLLPSCKASPHFGWYWFPVPLRAGGWAGLGGLVKYWGDLSAEDGHPPCTNRARRRVTSLIRPTTLPLRHAA